MRTRIVFFLALLLMLLELNAKTEVSFRRYTTDDGLPTNYVINMVQDPYGFLWLSTRNGLCRFDGYRFQTYHHDGKGANRLPHSNIIRQVNQNPNGLLWIRFFGDVYGCYDTNRGSFVNYTTDGKDPRGLHECTILNNGDTWLWRNGTGALRVVYDKGKATSKMFTAKEGLLGSDNVHFIAEDAYSQIWIGTSKGISHVKGDKSSILMTNVNFIDAITVANTLYLITKDGSVYTTDQQQKLTLRYNATKEGYNIQNIIGLARMGQNIVYVTRTDTYEYNTHDNTLTKALLQVPNAYIYKDNNGDYSIIDLEGYLHYMDNDGTLHQLRIFQHSIQRENYGVVKVVNDGKGRLWIATQGNGLFVYNLKNKTAEHYGIDDKGENGISINNLTNQILDKQGNVWIVLDNQGIMRASIVGTEQERILPNDIDNKARAAEMLTLTQENDSILLTANHHHEVMQLKKNNGEWQLNTLLNVGDDNCRAIIRDKDGLLWAGTDYHGLNINGKWYQHHDNNPQSLGNNHVTDIYQDSRQRIWVACASGGLDLVVKQNGDYVFRHFFNHNSMVRKILTIYECQHGDFFIGTNRGIIHFLPDELIADSSRYSTHLDNNEDNWFDVHCIKELNDGRIAYASTGAGLYISKNNRHADIRDFEHFTTADGLPDMTCASMVVDKKGMLWIGTQSGLARMNPKKKAFNTYHLSATPLGNVYANGQGQLLDNGELVFATSHGLLCFNPQSMTEGTQKQYTPHITNIYVGGRALKDIMQDRQDYDQRETLRLAYDQNTISFQVSCFNYGKEPTTEYAFKLKGEDKDWSMPSTNNIVTYSNLAPGTYTLFIRSRNNESDSQFTETAYSFVIEPPLWATWWAFFIYAIIALLILWLIIHSLWNQYRLRQKLGLERRMTQFKSEFFMNISHELRTPLMLIQGSSERLGKMGFVQGEAKQPVKNMQQSVNRLLRLTSQLLTFNKLQNDKLRLRLQNTDVIKLARNITDNFSDSAITRRITLNFTPNVASLEIPLDRDMFDKMLYNLLSNALKYTPDGGCVEVKINTDKEQLTMTVADTGIGIKPEQKRELFSRFARSTVAVDSIGIGLNLAYQLAHLHHGELTHTDNPKGGSIFTITLPVNAEEYNDEDWATEVVNEEQELHDSKDYEYAEMLPLPLNDRRIVLAEDDPDVRHYLTRELGRFFMVVPTDNGRMALEEIKKEKPELIVSDLVMPEMDGIELLKNIRQDDELFDIPFVMLTAMDDAKHHMQGIKSGADSYIPKPVSVDLLAVRCMKLLEQYERLKTSFSQEKLIPQQTPIITSEQDKKFRQILDAKIEAHLSDPKLNIDELGEAMNYRHSQFFSRVKEVTGMAPGEYIRRIKMERAAILLQDRTITISEVAYKLGFSDPLYFGRCFKQHYGKTPSQYRKGQ